MHPPTTTTPNNKNNNINPQGRATLEMKVAIRETPEGPRNPTLTIVLDGYNAPVSAGQVCVCVRVCVCACVWGKKDCRGCLFFGCWFEA